MKRLQDLGGCWNSDCGVYGFDTMKQQKDFGKKQYLSFIFA